MVNPKKMLEDAIGKTTPGLAKVLESVHAHLEEILETNQKQLVVSEEIRDILKDDKKDNSNTN